MKKIDSPIMWHAALLAIVLFFPAASRAQTANWIGASGGEWNTSGNWDIGVPGVGTNAVIPSSTTVNYNLPMTAASIRTLALGNTLNIATNGFVVNEAGASANPIIIATNATMNIAANGGVTVTNAGGAIIVANGGALIIGNNAFLLATNSTGSSGMNVGSSGNPSKGGGVTINSGGTLTLEKILSVAGVPSRVFVNGGTLNCLGGSQINENNNDGNQAIAVSGGTVNLGNFSVTRCNDGTGGLLLTNGTVNATAIQIGIANSIASSTVFGGTLTNTGIFTISDTTAITATSGDRKSYFHVRGGTVVSTGANGIIIANQSNASSSPSAGGSVLGGVLDVSGGTLIAEKITLIKDNTIVNAYASFTMSGGAVYLGSGGLVLNSGSSHIGHNLAFTGGTLGAKASWSSSAPLSLANTVTFKAADPANTPFNITLTGAITNTGSLTKTGGGTLTLSANNTYGGNTTINDGSLVLGNAGALPKGTALTLGSSGNAVTLDLAGFNAQISSLAVGGSGVAANQIITNSSASGTSTLIFSNSSANSTFGGVIAGGSKPIALTILGGNLTLTNQNNYTGNIFINNGKLALGGSGSTFIGPAIVLNNSAATFDVSGMGGLTLAAGQSLSGYGVVTGSMTVANCPLTPGTNGGTGTLTFTNNLTLNGNVTNQFDLLLDPDAAGSDQIIVGGTLNISGMNTIILNPLTGSLLQGTYKLIKCGAVGSGGASNFQIVGSPGTNLEAEISVTSTGVDLLVDHVGSAERIWVGDGVSNLWDHTTTNWLDNGLPDVFTDGNFAAFDDTGSATPAVNLTESVAPKTVTVDASANYTFSGQGKITGAAVLNKTNLGTLTILTTNDYSGPTTIDGGILQIGNGSVAGLLGTNTVEDESVLVLDLPGDNTFSNLIFGAGNFIQSGSGTLTLTASNTYSGGTLISAGTLQLNTGAWFGSGGVTNNSLLAFNSSGNMNVGNTISGTGGLVLRGGGTVMLTANNNYSGGTTVSNGTLLVDNIAGSGTGAGAVTISGSGKLGGTGSISGAVTMNSGGTLTPGNPLGTLTINNNFTVNSGAIFNFALGTNGDRVAVNGNLVLNGTLNISDAGGFIGGTYTLFTYTGTLTPGNLTIGTLPPNSSSTIDTNTPGQVNLIAAVVRFNIPSFPGALGFGAAATGARIGSVYHITTLADSGAGSFRDAVSHSGRIVVFDVGGYINLNSPVSCANNLTIAGQTAPGDGIGIMGHEVSFSARSNEIVRYVRFRPDSSSSGEDGINVGDGTNMIFDHISIEFGPYNNIDAHGDNGSDAITVQNSIIADPSSNGTSDKQGFGAHTEHVGGKMAWYYNLWVSEHNRQPLAKIDTIYVNNTIYNFQAGYTVAGTEGHFRHDIINNYFITGPTDPSGGDAFFQMNANQTIYSTGNLRDNNNNGVLDGSSISPGGGGAVLTAPWSPLSTNTTVFSTAGAYRYDISLSGVTPRDQVDSLVLSQVQTLGNGPTGTGAGTAGPGGGLYSSQTQTGLGNNGYGTINGGIAPVDTDGDAMPDYWENALASNPSVADNNAPGTDGYTKLENYLNWLAGLHAVAPKNSSVSVDLWKYTSGFTNASPAYSVFAPTNGIATLLADGHTAKFTAQANFTGLGSFIFSVSGNDGSAMTNTIKVLVAPTTLQFSAANPDGTNFVVAGGGGIPVTTFYLLTSTNLTLPFSNWMRLLTNQFDGGGNFNLTNPLDPTVPQNFYLLQLQ